MRIAILHYHYKPGGVSRVVKNTERILAETAPEIRTVTIGGDGAKAPISGIDYSSGESLANATTLIASLRDAARASLGGPPDLWHIHNHSLGKHPALVETIDRLAKQGPGILLHIHDFAEDGRPANHRVLREGEGGIAKLYPVATHIHYAVLNQRDYAFLHNLGVPPENLHHLPNPVHAPDISTEDTDQLEIPGDRFHLYPVRAVRRKNLGELALWAALGKDGDFFANSLGPTNPTFEPNYRHWQTLAQELKLPLELGINDRLGASFPKLVAKADTLVTTSMAEGFGLAFLEPWVMNKPLVGRNLPEITSDFTELGINLGHLYERLETPFDWLETTGFKDRLSKALTEFFEQYEKPLLKDAVQNVMASMVQEGKIDFGRLEEEDQIRILRKVCKDTGARAAISPNILSPPAKDLSIQKALVKASYNLRNYGEKLAGIYQQVSSCKIEAVTQLDPEKMLLQFLDAARFCFLRS